MVSNSTVSRAVRLALVAAAAYGPVANAQETEIEQIVVTGTRITLPGVASSSPITSVGADEIRLQQQPEVEKILRTLPAVLPADGQNVNNGTDGAATVNLRGLGAQRNLLLLDGKRLTPYNFDGIVDTSIIPTALIHRIDVVTGGASAVYGSDAISGAINFITKNRFEGVEINADYSITEKGDGDVRSISAVLGSNVADGRGNVVLGMTWSERDAVLLGQRGLGQLGIDTSSGFGYDDFKAGRGPTPAPAECAAPGAVTAGGSGTTVPTRTDIFNIPSGVFRRQFRNDGTLQAAGCSVFNFNPFNYYQTPLERFGGIALGSFEINEHAEAYGRVLFSSTEVRQQVAPSGVFGTAFWTPMSNPLMSNQARGVYLAAANANMGRLSQTGDLANWRDINGNGMVDAADELRIVYNRRTVEFGERSTTYNNDGFQMLFGLRGDIVGEWDYDLSYQYGESDRTNLSAGYTNLANIEQAIRSYDGVTCENGNPACVPINMWGGFGSITPEMARYSSAVAFEKQKYDQMIVSAVATGTAGKLPWVDSPIGVSLGYEYREESGGTQPDLCLQLAPTSCLGGAGGYTLPINGGFHVNELFAEAIVPVLGDITLVDSLDLELGYRWSEYAGYEGADDTETWKYGLNWRPIENLMVRAMKQRAVRAPNVGEIASPRVTALDNALGDPCSTFTPAANITPQLRALCVYTGVPASDVGLVADIEVGQINSFTGTNLDLLPEPEEADTLTIGFVWSPSFSGDVFRSMILSADYYDIEIKNAIGTYSAQDVLDGCYVQGDLSLCDRIFRVGGNLVNDGSGVETLTQNLDYIQAEGVEVAAQFNFSMGDWGNLTVSGNYNQYLTQEYLTDPILPVTDCLGYYGNSCGNPLPENRWIQRTTWSIGNLEFSYLWSHIGEAEIEGPQRDDTFEKFRKIDAYDYFDLFASVAMSENVRLSLSVSNVFDKDPPVVGNEAATTDANSGNTFPSVYSPLGRIFTAGINVRF